MTVLERVCEVVAREADVSVDSLTDKSKFIDLGMDSLEIVNLTMELEDEFNVGLRDESQILTIADAVVYIQKAQAA